jgi:hypothetical protein
VNPFLAFSFLRVSDASKAFLADANLFARLSSTRAPQYGQVRVFCFSEASSKLPQLGHSTTIVVPIGVSLPKDFSTNE